MAEMGLMKGCTKVNQGRALERKNYIAKSNSDCFTTMTRKVWCRYVFRTCICTYMLCNMNTWTKYGPCGMMHSEGELLKHKCEWIIGYFCHRQVSCMSSISSEPLDYVAFSACSSWLADAHYETLRMCFFCLSPIFGWDHIKFPLLFQFSLLRAQTFSIVSPRGPLSHVQIGPAKLGQVWTVWYLAHLLEIFNSKAAIGASQVRKDIRNWWWGVQGYWT